MQPRSWIVSRAQAPCSIWWGQANVRIDINSATRQLKFRVWFMVVFPGRRIRRRQCRGPNWSTRAIVKLTTDPHSSNRQHSKADFEVFRPTGATRCTDGGEIWHGGDRIGPLLRASAPNFTPISATMRAQEPPNWNFFTVIWSKCGI